jgi:formate dehydrogenase maturation protein FdhE
MKSPKDQRSIIKDILALYQRYGADEIERAVQSLKNGDALREISDLTVNVVRRADQVSPNRLSRAATSRKKSKRDYLSDLIAEIESKSDPTQSDVVELLRAASKGEMLNDGRSLRHFSARLGISESAKKVDRFTMLKQVGEALLTKAPEERAYLIGFAKSLEGRPSSLQGWSDLIVKK